MRYQYSIGATLESMQYLFELGIKAPRNEFKPYSRTVQTGSGAVIGQGWAINTWDWGVITDVQRASLKSLCTGLSSQVYIKTLNDSLSTPAWETYRARMVWTPEAEDAQNNARLKFSINFKLLEKIT